MKRRAIAAVSFSLCVACASSAAAPSHQITVGAAASLSGAFQQIALSFERTHPGETVRFTFGPSNGLAIQIQQGAPIDVFASAAPKWLDLVAKDPGLLVRATFARNRLVVLVPRDNPAHVARFADLTRRGVRLVLAAQGVPAGDYARQALANGGLRSALRNVVSNEQDVEGVVAKVTSGDADAGIVYETDLTPSIAGAVRSIEIPRYANVAAVYQIGVISVTHLSGPARDFISYVLGAGQGALRRAGFEAPA